MLFYFVPSIPHALSHDFCTCNSHRAFSWSLRVRLPLTLVRFAPFAFPFDPLDWSYSRVSDMHLKSSSCRRYDNLQGTSTKTWAYRCLSFALASINEFQQVAHVMQMTFLSSRLNHMKSITAWKRRSLCSMRCVVLRKIWRSTPSSFWGLTVLLLGRYVESIVMLRQGFLDAPYCLNKNIAKIIISATRLHASCNLQMTCRCDANTFFDARWEALFL